MSLPSHQVFSQSTPQYLMLLACCSPLLWLPCPGWGNSGVLSFPASSVDLLSQVQCVCVGSCPRFSFLFALHVPLVLGELRWGNCRGISANSSAWLVPALGGRQESLGTGACTKLPKFGLDFASQLSGQPYDATHSQYLYMTGPPKSVLPPETPGL